MAITTTVRMNAVCNDLSDELVGEMIVNEIGKPTLSLYMDRGSKGIVHIQVDSTDFQRLVNVLIEAWKIEKYDDETEEVDEA